MAENKPAEAAPKPPKQKLQLKDILNRNLILILIIQILCNMSLNAVSTLFNVAGRGAGIATSFIGIAASAYSIAGMLARAPAGMLANSDKKKIALIGVLIFRLICQFIYGTFGMMGGWQFVVGRAIYGLGWSFVGIVLPAIVAMMMDKKVMGFTYAIVAMVNNFTTDLIKAPAQAMYEKSGNMIAPLLLSTGLAVAAIVLIMLLDFNDERIIRATPKKKEGGILKNFNWRYCPVCLLLSLVVFTWNMSNTYDQALGTERGIDMVSILATVSIINAFISFVTQALCDIISPKYVLCILYVLLGGGAFILGGATEYTPFLIGYAMCVVGKTYSAVINIYLFKNCAEDQRATVHATNYLMTDVLSIFSGTIVGVVLQSLGYTMGYRVFAVVAIVCAVLTFLFADKLLAYANSAS